MNQSNWTNTFLSFVVLVGMSNYLEICASFINSRCLLAGVLITASSVSLQEPSSSGTSNRLLPVIRDGKARERNLTAVRTKGNKEAENRYKTLLEQDAEHCGSVAVAPGLKRRQSGCACTHVTFSLGSWTTSWIASSTGAIIKFISRFLRRSSAFAPRLTHCMACCCPGAWGENTDLLAQAIQRVASGD